MANKTKKISKVNERYPLINKDSRFSNNPFSPNIINSNQINSKGKDVSGYIIREVYMKDKNGNIKVARETQVVNSWKKIGQFKWNN